MRKGNWKGLSGLCLAAVLAVCPGPVTVTADDVAWETASPGSALKQETGTVSGTVLQEERPAAVESEEGTGTAAPEGETETTAPEEKSSVAAYLYQGSQEILAGGYIPAAEEGMSRITVEFDTAFPDQEFFQNVQIPQDQKLKGWRLWGYNSDSGFVGQDSCEIPGEGPLSASQYQDLNIDPAMNSLLVIPLWRNAREILDGDSLEMHAGDNCILSEGMWTVDGDSTMYSGGRTVYGARDGIFTFRKQE